ncbi:MAG: SPFH domain-containing protein [Pseudonocardiaceae bacterium]|nr:SPFH domain-containing protein [Pseudonocardiaceae bacterium]
METNPPPRASKNTPAVEMPEPHIREQAARALSGFAVIAAIVLAAIVGVALIAVRGTLQEVGGSSAMVVVGVVLVVTAIVLARGLTPVSPGEARVVQLHGRYVGTLRTAGLRWVNPITSRLRVSTRIRNHETEVSKVNDADGNPIEIAAVVVWQVADTAQATFEVDDFVEFVSIQAETAVRHIANSYPYDTYDQSRLSLRDNADEITERLSQEVVDRVAPAGVVIIESRITHLAYAAEIASAMLRRQQAAAVVAARRLIVEGAVGMVEMALERLNEKDIVDLDEERKATMASNLLVVLVGDNDTQPVVNTGSLYQ